MSADQEQEVIVIQEEKDGSATIELPPSIPSPEANDDGGSDEADDRARQKEMVVGGAVDEAAEALREQKRLKRSRRKEYHKAVSTEKDVKLTHLERQNQQLLERLSVLERKSHGSDLARLNKAIEDQDNRILFAKQKISEATRTGNGELLTSAQEMWFEARRQAEALANLKQRATAPQKQRTIQAPDPQLQRHANKWMSENTWYDPNGKDPDSRRALNEDSILAEEGYDPKTADYWEELDRRLQRVVPHRYTEDANDRPRSRPRSAVTGSGREFASTNGRSNSFTLSPDQVKAMKDAGMWDDAEKRAKMIRRYALEARNNNG
tara:strand:+ start:1137 stop:2102 length:966 start_codon:yes stop_codon:yes gene_type:complete